MTVKTNSSGAPQETIAVAAGIPLVYVPAEGGTAPFAGDVTKLYVTNASGGIAILNVLVLKDPTP